MQKLIILDGTKGAGKTTVGKLLSNKISNTEYMSLDVERGKLEHFEKSRAEQNKEAFENVIFETSQLLNSGKNVVVDCGLTPERVTKLDSLAQERNVRLHKFLLQASYDTLLERVRGRDALRGKETDVVRFDEVRKIVYNKDFEDFCVIETDNLDPNEITTRIKGLIEK